VQPGNNLGTIPLMPSGLPASITGQITSSTGSAAVAVDITVSALQSIGNNLQVTVPLAQQSAATATLTTGKLSKRAIPGWSAIRKLSGLHAGEKSSFSRTVSDPLNQITTLHGLAPHEPFQWTY
jgi:hypothetical protein